MTQTITSEAAVYHACRECMQDLECRLAKCPLKYGDIEAFCLLCAGSTKEVKACRLDTCQLHPFRLPQKNDKPGRLIGGKKPFKPEHKAKLRNNLEKARAAKAQKRI